MKMIVRGLLVLQIALFATAGDAVDLPGPPSYPVPPSDVFLEPAVITNPGPEYSDEFRCYQAAPSVEYIADGRLWAAWFGGGMTEDKDTCILLATSGDGGNTWGKIKLAVDPDCTGTVDGFDPASWPSNDQIGRDPRITGPRRLAGPCIWKDPQGRLWLFFQQEKRNAKDGIFRPMVLWSMMTENPKDENPVWSKPRAIAIGVMLNKPTVLSTGEWLLPVACWRGELSAGVVVSRDSGASFEYLGGAGIFPEKGRNCDEHMIIERRDGSLLMLVRGHFSKIMESVSTDRGKTWTPMHQKDADRWQLAHANSRFFVRRLASGNLLLVKHGALGELVIPRSRLMAFLSDDDGRSWKGGLMLDDRLLVSYPDGTEGDHGQLYVTYDYERQGNMPGGKSIHLARFTETDVLAGRIVTKGSQSQLLVNQAKGINLHSFGLRDNADGDDLSEAVTRSAPAELEPLNGEIAKLENGATLFIGRHDTAVQLPAALLGKQFIRAPRDQVRFKVKESGLVYVLTPLSKRENRLYNGLPPILQPYSQVDFLLNQGFRKAGYPETLLMHPGPDNVVSVYYKEMPAGEEMEIGEWALVVF
jgi:hypothetical protein